MEKNTVKPLETLEDWIGFIAVNLVWIYPIVALLVILK